MGSGTPTDPYILDTSSEEWREYHYADGAKVRINNPVETHIFEGKSGWTQRVMDADGVTHRPTPGWLSMSWKPYPGKPAYIA